MRLYRWRAPLVLAGSLATWACAAGPGRAGARAVSESDATQARHTPRRAPGIAIDPVLSLPRVSMDGEANAGLLVLATPPGMTEIRQLLRRYFQAVTRENAEQLESLLTEQAVLESTAGRHPARGALRARFSQSEFAALEGLPLYRERDVQLYRRGETEALALERAPDLAPGQVFARVPLTVSHTGKTRLLPDRLGFVIQRGSSGYRIATIVEELAAQ